MVARTPGRTESEAAKGTGPSAAGRGPRPGRDASPRRRDRRRQQRALRRGPAGSGSRTRSAGLSVSPRTCIVWRTGCSSAG